MRNLPSTVTSPDIMQEFENFGRIKHDGVFLRNRMVHFASNSLNILFHTYSACEIRVSVLLYRILVSAMPLLSLKMFRVSGMQSRFELFRLGKQCQFL